jgi:hypothetical protein
MRLTKLLLYTCTAFLLLYSCKKESLLTSPSASLRITADTVRFDTVFTTVGSITRSFKIVNENDQPLRLSEVALAGGSNSPFRLNINGRATNSVSNLDIPATDSIYIFTAVTVNPSTANLPFILTDSIRITYNGNTRYVQLEAYGQNARFIRNGMIRNNTVWDNQLPYIILGGLTVDTLASLTLQAGTKVYAHNNAPIIIYGSLQANGTVSSPIVFTGDRLDAPYNGFPASWPGIYFRGSSINNKLTFTHVRNANQAVSCFFPSNNANPKLDISQCIIDNAYDAGLFCFNTEVNIANSLISNCASNILVQAGGIYNIRHCTVASYNNDFFSHRTPVVSLSNSAIINGVVQSAPLDARIVNSICWSDGGFVEIDVQVFKNGTAAVQVIFDHSLFRAATDPLNSTFVQCIRNVDPRFDSIDVANHIYDFHVTKNAFAPGLNAGIITGLPLDLDNRNRAVGIPDLGAYVKQ